MPSRSTEEVLNSHLRASSSGNLDGVMDDFAEGAIFYKTDVIFHGKDEIKQLFADLPESLPPGSDIQIKQQVVDGELAYLFGVVSQKKLKSLLPPIQLLPATERL